MNSILKTVYMSPGPRGRSINPYTTLLCDSLLEAGVAVREWTPRSLFDPSSAVWHFHWPESMLRFESTFISGIRAAGFLLLLMLARLRGITLVWTSTTSRRTTRAIADCRSSTTGRSPA